MCFVLNLKFSVSVGYMDPKHVPAHTQKSTGKPYALIEKAKPTFRISHKGLIKDKPKDVSKTKTSTFYVLHKQLKPPRRDDDVVHSVEHILR